MKKFSAYDIFSIIVATIAFLLFGSMFVGCYVWAVLNLSFASILGGALMSIIPGLLTYGIGTATVEFVRGDTSYAHAIRKPKKYRKPSANNEAMRNVVSILVVFIAILLFGGIVVGAFVWAFMNFSFASLLSATLMSIIPALACWGCIGAAVEFIKNNASKK